MLEDICFFHFSKSHFADSPSAVWACWSCHFTITVWEVMMLYSISEELWLSMSNWAKIEEWCGRACIRECVCFTEVLLDQLSRREKSETQTRGFLSGCSCCLLVYWVRIYYSAIFLCYVLQSRREMGEGEKQRGGPSNSTGVRTHWIVWSSWVARLFLAQPCSLLVALMGEREASLLCTKGSGQALKATFGCLKPRAHVVSLRKGLKLVTVEGQSGFLYQELQQSCRAHTLCQQSPLYNAVSIPIVVQDYTRLTRKNKDTPHSVPIRAALHHSFFLLSARPSLLC